MDQAQGPIADVWQRVEETLRNGDLDYEERQTRLKGLLMDEENLRLIKQHLKNLKDKMVLDLEQNHEKYVQTRLLGLIRPGTAEEIYLLEANDKNLREKLQEDLQGGTENFDIKVALMLRGLKNKLIQQTLSENTLNEEIKDHDKQDEQIKSNKVMSLAEKDRYIERLKQSKRCLEQMRDELLEEIIIREMTGYDYGILMFSIIGLVFLVASVLISYSCVPLSIGLTNELKGRGFIVAQQGVCTDIAVDVHEFKSGKECPHRALGLKFEVVDQQSKQTQSPSSYTYAFNWNDTISFCPGDFSARNYTVSFNICRANGKVCGDGEENFVIIVKPPFEEIVQAIGQNDLGWHLDEEQQINYRLSVVEWYALPALGLRGIKLTFEDSKGETISSPLISQYKQVEDLTTTTQSIQKGMAPEQISFISSSFGGSILLNLCIKGEKGDILININSGCDSIWKHSYIPADQHIIGFEPGNLPQLEYGFLVNNRFVLGYKDQKGISGYINLFSDDIKQNPSHENYSSSPSQVVAAINCALSTDDRPPAIAAFQLEYIDGMKTQWYLIGAVSRPWPSFVAKELLPVAKNQVGTASKLGAKVRPELIEPKESVAAANNVPRTYKKPRGERQAGQPLKKARFYGDTEFADHYETLRIESRITQISLATDGHSIYRKLARI